MRIASTLLTAGLLVAVANGARADAGEPARGSAIAAPAVTLTRTNHHGWPDALVLSNGQVEAVIVPQVGRVMQFRFPGTPGPFWENPAWFGKSPDPRSSEWGNFGGDKTWPAPQADWPKLTARAWPPPAGFDAMPVQAGPDSRGLTLTSGVDPHYGIRTRRRVELPPGQPVMRLVTEYEKVSGDPVRVAVWVITQLRDPVEVFLRASAAPTFPAGYRKQSADEPAGLRVDGGLISLRRDSRQAAKIGTDGGDLLWVGTGEMVRILCPRGPEPDYPDEGASVEVYTNPDPLPYVELETLGPLVTLKTGDRVTRTNTYQLFKRSAAAALDEARRLLPAER